MKYLKYEGEVGNSLMSFISSFLAERVLILFTVFQNVIIKNVT
jgi:hypothetical protein